MGPMLRRCLDLLTAERDELFQPRISRIGADGKGNRHMGTIQFPLSSEFFFVGISTYSPSAFCLLPPFRR